MSIFRRLSLRRRSRKGRSRSWPPPAADNATQARRTSDGGGEVRASTIESRQPTTNDELSATNQPFAATIESYEDRIDELGQLMAKQGRCLDELTNRSRVLSNENHMLRERLSAGVIATKPAATEPTRSPLKSIINSTQKLTKDESAAKEAAKRLKAENALLCEQADLLAKELNVANQLVSERDESISSLSKELSLCLEKARSLMAEKKSWKETTFQQAKEVEALEAKVKRSSTLHSELSQTADQYLAERTELEGEVSDLESQMLNLTSKLESQEGELISKQTELDKTVAKLREANLATNLVKQEAKDNAENVLALQDKLRGLPNLEMKLKESSDKLADSQIAQHKLQTTNASLQAEMKALVQKHKSNISSWTKGQNKVITAMKEQYQDESRSQQKHIDSLRRTNSSLESDCSQYAREVQSLQHRCNALEKLLSSKHEEHKVAVATLTTKAMECEQNSESSKLREKDLRSEINSLKEKLTTLQDENKDKQGRHAKILGGLQSQLTSLQEKNNTLSTRIPTLEEAVAKTRQACARETLKAQQLSEQTVREANIECEALRVANENKRLKTQSAQELLEKQSSIHQATLDQLSLEKKNLALKMEKAVANEREVGKCLMNKVQELNSSIQKLTAEKLQLSQHANKHVDQIYTLEKIIANGEMKLSQFGKQLARSMQDQERRIMKETELKRELNGVRMELERLKRREGV